MKKRIVTLSLLISAGILIVIGVLQDQQSDVLAKAIRICLECVGIG